MARFCASIILLMVMAVTMLGNTVSAQNKPLGTGQTSSTNGKVPTLLTIEQQQDLLEQLAQLQRQTQQLLAAQQSLAAVAAAAATTSNNNGVGGGVNGHRPTNQRLSQQPPSTASTSSTSSSSSATQSLLSSSPQQPAQRQTKPTTNHVQVNAPVQPASLSDDSGVNGAQSQSQASSSATSSSSAAAQLPQGPQINWGKCPELEPSEQEKLTKASVITKCLETTPLPGNITRESVEQHREQIAACALRAEGWFTAAGGYDFGKAEREIKNKRLQKDLESQVLSYHSQCQAESEEKYPTSSSSIIAQIQLYQACMDYFISDVCGIEVNETGGGGGESQQFA